MKRKVVAVTGASAGIGRATIREFAKDGCALGLIARGTQGLEDAKREVEALGGTAIALPTDVADAAAVESAAERIEKELGPIDVWVNVAFTNVFAPFHELTPEEYQRITDVSYLGFVFGTMSALKTHALQEQRDDRASRFSVVLSQHSVAGRLLRSKKRDSRVYRFVSL